MKTTRRTPDVINEPLLIIGIPRWIFLGIVVAGFLTLTRAGSWPAVIVVGACFMGAQLIAKQDPRALPILIQVWLRLKDAYDPAKRAPFELIIIDELEEQ